MIQIKIVEKEHEFQIAYKIRVEVFVREQGVPLDMELDEWDKEAKHILLYQDNLPVACGRIVIQEKQATIGRIAVLKKYRNHKYGKQICEKLIAIAKENQVETIILHAQCYAVGFYKKLGFKEYGNVFEEAGINHREMRLPLISGLIANINKSFAKESE